MWDVYLPWLFNAILEQVKHATDPTGRGTSSCEIVIVVGGRNPLSCLPRSRPGDNRSVLAQDGAIRSINHFL
jgi:hypothetical protein